MNRDSNLLLVAVVQRPEQRFFAAIVRRDSKVDIDRADLRNAVDVRLEQRCSDRDHEIRLQRAKQRGGRNMIHGSRRKLRDERPLWNRLVAIQQPLDLIETAAPGIGNRTTVLRAAANRVRERFRAACSTCFSIWVHNASESTSFRETHAAIDRQYNPSKRPGCSGRRCSCSIHSRTAWTNPTNNRRTRGSRSSAGRSGRAEDDGCSEVLAEAYSGLSIPYHGAALADSAEHPCDSIRLPGLSIADCTRMEAHGSRRRASCEFHPCERSVCEVLQYQTAHG